MGSRRSSRPRGSLHTLVEVLDHRGRGRDVRGHVQVPPEAGPAEAIVDLAEGVRRRRGGFSRHVAQDRDVAERAELQTSLPRSQDRVAADESSRPPELRGDCAATKYRRGPSAPTNDGSARRSASAERVVLRADSTSSRTRSAADSTGPTRYDVGIAWLSRLAASSSARAADTGGAATRSPRPGSVRPAERGSRARRGSPPARS